MIEILNQSTDKTLVAHMSGEISGEEYVGFVKAVDECFAKGDEVNLVLDLKGVEFYKDFDAMKKDFEFTTGEFKKLHRVALVGEEKWLKRVNKLVGLFSPVKEKHFPEGKLEEAVDWANEGKTTTHTHTEHEPARLADRPEDYARFKLAKGHVEPWEDGIRVDTGAPNLEWWYIDADLDDGTGLCLIFATKDGTRPNQPLAPQLEIDLTLPDGTRLVRSTYFKPEEFSASKDGCDVRMGPYRFTGDTHEYRITGAADELWADVHLEGLTESWRPETGHLFFGPNDENLFAWTPFVPYGKVTATYKIGDKVYQATGRGYHDHNWTNKDIGQLIDHWWWARGEVGPYTFIAAHIVASKKYGYIPFHWYMLARDGKPIADDGSKMTFTTHGAEIDEHTGKPIPESICYDYQDGDTRYELTLTRQRTLVDYTWIDFAKGWQKSLLKLLRYPGGYMRFSAVTSLNCYQEGKLVEHYENTGAFEQIFYAREIEEESLEHDMARSIKGQPVS